MLDWLKRRGRLLEPGAVTKNGSDRPGNEHVSERMREAFAFRRAGNLKQAANLCQEVLQKQPNATQALYLLGEIAYQAGQNDRAIDLLSSATALKGTVATFHHMLGCALEAGGELKKAIASYRTAHGLNPSSAEICNDMACALYAAGREKAAWQHFDQALAIDPCFASAHFNLGEIAKERNQLDQAAERFRLGLAIAPRYARGHVSLAKTLKRQNKLEQAEHHIREAVQIMPDDIDAHRVLANILWTQEKFYQLPTVYRDIVQLKLAAAQNGPKIREANEAKVAIKNTTLCCIDCRYYELAIGAIRSSMGRCVFDRILFLTDRKCDVADVEVIEIKKIESLSDYSKFIIKNLIDYIETDFVLVVQYDGYILNAKAWTERFQEYDYIGARWGFRDKYNVGNGGFSLRSRRLLTALQDSHISEFVPEDVMICVKYREFLEKKYGIQFAPGEIADLFSFEEKPLPGTFGFHGLSYLVDIAGMSQSEIENYSAEFKTAALRWHRSPPTPPWNFDLTV